MPRLPLHLLGQDTPQFPVQQALSLIGVGHPVDRAADLPFEGDWRQPVGRDILCSNGTIFVCDLVALFQVRISISYWIDWERAAMHLA